MRCLARNPDYRPESAAELAHELAAASPEPPTQALPQSAGTVATAVRTTPYPVRRPRAVADRRLWLAVAAVLAVVAIVLGLALARNDTSSSSPPRAPSVALVPAASTPAERARNLAAWLRRYSK